MRSRDANAILQELLSRHRCPEISVNYNCGHCEEAQVTLPPVLQKKEGRLSGRTATQVLKTQCKRGEQRTRGVVTVAPSTSSAEDEAIPQFRIDVPAGGCPECLRLRRLPDGVGRRESVRCGGVLLELPPAAAEGPEEVIPVGVSARQLLQWVQQAQQTKPQRILLTTPRQEPVSGDFAYGLWVRVRQATGCSPMLLAAVLWIIGSLGYALYQPASRSSVNTEMLYEQLQRRIADIPVSADSPQHAQYKQYYLRQYQQHVQDMEATQAQRRRSQPLFSVEALQRGLSMGALVFAAAVAYCEYHYGVICSWMDWIEETWSVLCEKLSKSTDPLADSRKMERFLKEMGEDQQRAPSSGATAGTTQAPVQVAKSMSSKEGRPPSAWHAADAPAVPAAPPAAAGAAAPEERKQAPEQICPAPAASPEPTPLSEGAAPAPAARGGGVAKTPGMAAAPPFEVEEMAPVRSAAADKADAAMAAEPDTPSTQAPQSPPASSPGPRPSGGRPFQEAPPANMRERLRRKVVERRRESTKVSTTKETAEVANPAKNGSTPLGGSDLLREAEELLSQLEAEELLKQLEGEEDRKRGPRKKGRRKAEQAPAPAEVVAADPVGDATDTADAEMQEPDAQEEADTTAASDASGTDEVNHSGASEEGGPAGSSDMIADFSAKARRDDEESTEDSNLGAPEAAELQAWSSEGRQSDDSCAAGAASTGDVGGAARRAGRGRWADEVVDDAGSSVGDQCEVTLVDEPAFGLAKQLDWTRKAARRGVRQIELRPNDEAAESGPDAPEELLRRTSSSSAGAAADASDWQRSRAQDRRGSSASNSVNDAAWSARAQARSRGEKPPWSAEASWAKEKQWSSGTSWGQARNWSSDRPWPGEKAWAGEKPWASEKSRAAEKSWAAEKPWASGRSPPASYSSRAWAAAGAPPRWEQRPAWREKERDGRAGGDGEPAERRLEPAGRRPSQSAGEVKPAAGRMRTNTLSVWADPQPATPASPSAHTAAEAPAADRGACPGTGLGEASGAMSQEEGEKHTGGFSFNPSAKEFSFNPEAQEFSFLPAAGSPSNPEMELPIPGEPADAQKRRFEDFMDAAFETALLDVPEDEHGSWSSAACLPFRAVLGQPNFGLPPFVLADAPQLVWSEVPNGFAATAMCLDGSPAALCLDGSPAALCLGDPPAALCLGDLTSSMCVGDSPMPDGFLCAGTDSMSPGSVMPEPVVPSSTSAA